MSEGKVAPHPGDETGARRRLRPDPLKGETAAQMRHGEDLLANSSDTSIDGPWEVRNAAGPTDYYVGFVVLVGMLPKMLALYVPLFLLLLPATALNRCYYMHYCPPSTQGLPGRGTSRWLAHCACQWVLTLPAQAIIFVNHIIDMALWSTFGLLYATLTLNWGTVYRNYKVTAPYRGGPSLYLKFGDIVTAAGGMMYRQGLFEFHQSFTLMFLLNPWIKYWLTGNLWCGELGERFITQIGQSMGDLNIDDIETQFKRCISDARLTADGQKELDEMFFCPHYPYPPTNSRRCFAIGMQHASKTTTFVHTTHFKAADGTDTGVQALSKSSLHDVYRVMLWWNNPFHIFTGWVEASISSGKPSQAEKYLGAEHPMWLINGHNFLAASRAMKFSVGWIDVFFDLFIPHFQRFIRGNATTWENADKVFEFDPKKGYETLAGVGTGEL
jgi:hypothetical protein